MNASRLGRRVHDNHLYIFTTSSLPVHQDYIIHTSHPNSTHTTFTMAPLPTSTSITHPNLTYILSHITKRAYSECAYYESSCSTHRLAIIIIIIAVGIVVSAILSLLYVRSRRSRAAKMRASVQQRRVKMSSEDWPLPNETRYPVERVVGYGAPPPYEPRRPERVVRNGGREWR